MDLKQDKDGNMHDADRFISIDSSGCTVFGAEKKIVGAIGVKDLVVVSTESGLLVCSKEDVNVADLVGKKPNIVIGGGKSITLRSE